MSNTERARLLDEYRVVTEQLMALFAQADKFIDIDRMNAYLAMRDHLGLRVQELEESGVPVLEGEREQARTIRTMDEKVAARMRTLMQETQRSLVQLRTHQQGLNHYRDEYSVDAYFIDRKK